MEILKPLSYAVYLRENKKKAAGMIISIALGIFLIAVMQFFTNSMIDTNKRGETKYEFLSEVWSTKGMLPKNVMNKLTASRSIEKIIKVASHSYMINNIIGSDTDYSGYFADEEDIGYIMDKMGLKLSQGRMPKNGENEIIINENVARARNLKMGDYMGSDVSSYDYFSGKYKVCGIIKGDVIVSFAAMTEEEIKNHSIDETYVIIPKVGKLDEVSKLLKSLPKQGISTYTYDNVIKDDAADEGNFNMIFNIVIIVMIIVLSVSLGNSAYVHYYQRRMEFGLLSAVGYSKAEIILRAFKEIVVSCFIGFTAGLFIINIFKLLMNKIYVYPHGLSIFAVKPDLILRIIGIPLFICIFSLIPVSDLLSKIEPISIIERNE